MCWGHTETMVFLNWYKQRQGGQGELEIMYLSSIQRCKEAVDLAFEWVLLYVIHEIWLIGATIWKCHFGFRVVTPSFNIASIPWSRLFGFWSQRGAYLFWVLLFLLCGSKIILYIKRWFSVGNTQKNRPKCDAFRAWWLKRFHALYRHIIFYSLQLGSLIQRNIM